MVFSAPYAAKFSDAQQFHSAWLNMMMRFARSGSFGSRRPPLAHDDRLMRADVAARGLI